MTTYILSQDVLQKLERKDTAAFLEAISSCTTVIIDGKKTRATADTFIYITQVLKQACDKEASQIKELKFSRCFVNATEQEIIAFAQSLPSSIMSLNITENLLGKKIIPFVQNLPPTLALTNLNLTYNRLDLLEEKDFSIFGASIFTSLSSLDVSWNLLGRKMIFLLQNLRAHPNLRHFSLAENGKSGHIFKAQDYAAFGQAINPLLTSLDLSGNEFHGEIINIIKSMELRSLETLNLANSSLEGLNEEEIITVGQAICTSFPSLTLLDLSHNSLKNAAFILLQNFSPTQNIKLNLSDNKITGLDAMNAVISKEASTARITALNFGFLHATDGAVTCLLEKLAVMSHLAKLTVEANNECDLVTKGLAPSLLPAFQIKKITKHTENPLHSVVKIKKVCP